LQVDPGAIGLTTTSDGKPKVIDIIDCSGSGDVAMGVPIKAESVVVDGNTTSAGCLQGLSGRVLKLNSSWTNPTGMFRLGLKVISIHFSHLKALDVVVIFYKNPYHFKMNDRCDSQTFNLQF
jgi:hypothetical protein